MPGSDIDFIVFPSNQASIPYAQALQKEIQFALQRLIEENNLSFKVDDIMADTINFQVPPQQAREKLLQPTREVHDFEFGITLQEPSIAPTVLRDIKFVYGDKSAFDQLVEASRDRLFTPSSCTDPISIEITRQLLETPLREKLQVLQTRLSSGNTDNFDPKDEGIRVIELFAWLLRAHNSVDIKNPTEVINAVNALTNEEKEKLANAFKFLVLLSFVTRNSTPVLRQGEHPKLTTENEGTIAAQTQIPTPLFRAALIEHLTNVHRITSKHTQACTT